MKYEFQSNGSLTLSLGNARNNPQRRVYVMEDPKSHFCSEFRAARLRQGGFQQSLAADFIFSTMLPQEIEFPGNQSDEKREREGGWEKGMVLEAERPARLSVDHPSFPVTELIPGTLIKQRKARLPSHLIHRGGLLTADYSPAGSFFSSPRSILRLAFTRL